MSEQAICCTLVSCSCESFKPGKLRRRQCEHCKHGWVAHALSKLKVQHLYQGGQVEIVHSSVVFDICSLMLYGTQAVPVRLKILLDRLFSVLKQEEVVQILNALDWTLQDYIRGYVLQDVTGRVLDRWVIMTLEEEMAALQQFLRFGETKSIVELMAVQDKESQAVLVPSSRTSSGIRAFIESSGQHGIEPPLGPPASSSIHHFENLISSMAFLLPFQYLSSLPAPLLGSTPGSFLPGAHTPIPTLSAETGLVGSSSTTFDSDAEKSTKVLGAATPKMEAEDIPASDAYSDAPSTPSMTSDFMQTSPEGKHHPSEQGGAPGGGAGAGLKKGRVFCSACEKTFYDKGTLKIHYNAVHLKIKHRCTVQGCNMVFSSLRSRNRHSANPNPRLHLPMNRGGREREAPPAPYSEGEEESPESQEAQESRPVSSYVVSSSDCRLQSAFPTTGHNGVLFPNLKTVQPVLPFYRSLVTPAELAHTPGAPPSLPLISSSSVPAHSGLRTVDPGSDPVSDPVPKKKSRKSSMPVKIETEAVEPAVESLSGLSPSPALGPAEQPDSSGAACEKPEPCYQDCTELRGHQDPGPRTQQAQEGGVITSTSPQDLRLIEHHSLVSDGAVPPLENGAQPCETDARGQDYSTANGGLFRRLTFRGSPKTGDRDDPSPNIQPPSVHSDGGEILPHPHSNRTHYCSPHEVQGSTGAGCNTTFPISRSRDRYSASFSGHPCGASDSVGPVPTVCSDTPAGLPQALPLTQQSVIFKGHHRMGLVHPLSTEQDSMAGPAVEEEEEEEDQEAVLDLSATSASQSERHARPPWDSDGDSEAGGAGEDSNDSQEGADLPLREGLSPNLGDSPGTRPGDAPITCPACHKAYSNKSTFRAHYKTVHLRLLHKCKVPGCSTSFSSVRSRNRHSQNPNLHRNLSATTTAAHRSPQREQPSHSVQGLLA
ncbi:zinc finger protein basonuclin-1-like [Conger conger]|uniref:zinc finger protein basonuclin-1-like n=1 Tax=Conger conger TaxID=82655 RepID=UPI002A5AE662|nr:zinc finger protein basonuclin-1-like [Conger conger]